MVPNAGTGNLGGRFRNLNELDNFWKWARWQFGDQKTGTAP